MEQTPFYWKPGSQKTTFLCSISMEKEAGAKEINATYFLNDLQII